MTEPAVITLDDLRRGRAVGRGVSSTVEVAAHRKTDEVYALKVIPKARITTEAHLAAVHREKDLLGSLKHAGVVGFHRTLKDEKHLYFLLEYLSGGELLWHMRRSEGRRLPEATARLCTGALLLPLRYMDEAGVVYRDLKPTNIVFSRAGRLKLVDFGHAKRAARNDRSMSVCGTPHYHAPETVRGEEHGLPAQLWALGVLIVEMLRGAPPFGMAGGAEPDDLAALHARILSEEPELAGVPEAAVPLVQALLLRDRAQRSARFAEAYASVMAEPWLASLDWPALEAGALVPELAFAQHAEEAAEVSGLPTSDPWDA